MGLDEVSTICHVEIGVKGILGRKNSMSKAVEAGRHMSWGWFPW